MFVAALKARPGEWALYSMPVSAPSSAFYLRAAFPGVEATSRLRPDGKFDIYARWVGES